MRVFGIEGEFGRLWKNTAQELSPREIEKLRAISLFREIRNARVVCETFGIGRATLYRWLRRFDSKDLTSLREEVVKKAYLRHIF
jgi:transposase